MKGIKKGLRKKFYYVILFLILTVIVLSSPIFYFTRGYGVSNGKWDILTILFFSELKPLRIGEYADYVNDDGIPVVHKIVDINKTHITFSNYFQSIDIVERENVGGTLLYILPIVRTEGRQGFLASCHYDNSINNENNNCEYLYCIYVDKENNERCYNRYVMEDCEK